MKDGPQFYIYFMKVRKSIKSLVEEAESVSIDSKENIEVEKESDSKLDLSLIHISEPTRRRGIS